MEVKPPHFFIHVTTSSAATLRGSLTARQTWICDDATTHGIQWDDDIIKLTNHRSSSNISILILHPCFLFVMEARLAYRMPTKFRCHDVELSSLNSFFFLSEQLPSFWITENPGPRVEPRWLRVWSHPSIASQTHLGRIANNFCLDA